VNFKAEQAKEGFFLFINVSLRKFQILKTFTLTYNASRHGIAISIEYNALLLSEECSPNPYLRWIFVFIDNFKAINLSNHICLR